MTRLVKQTSSITAFAIEAYIYHSYFLLIRSSFRYFLYNFFEFSFPLLTLTNDSRF